ncbi:MAG: A/G-specific adenine glycosylase [Bryobacter sp.]|jgi:A/G-specific adenine glycosylase|nr:A/G-specific adenine glycosylase [Bryobacter sp. CoA8 C33]
MTFAPSLHQWFLANQRDLPWRHTRDPYRIWLSEIMLQQTRVTAVIPYYERFLARFPDFPSLAAAPESDLLAAWAGLGYYSRARNLQRAAQQMLALGRFPSTYDEIRALPGVGDYTAGAVSSIAFGLPHIGIDGNILRVIARYTADSGDISQKPTRLRISAFAESHLPADSPGIYQQALMELGATICTPQSPKCLLCPLASSCAARRDGLTTQLPIKLTNKTTIEETRHLLWFSHNDALLLLQHPPTSPRLAGFWDLPDSSLFPRLPLGPPQAQFSHSIVNHKYELLIHTPRLPRRRLPQLHWIPFSRFPELPLSTITKKAIARMQ